MNERKTDPISDLVNEDAERRRRIKKAVQLTANYVNGEELRRFAVLLHEVLCKIVPPAEKGVENEASMVGGDADREAGSAP